MNIQHHPDDSTLLAFGAGTLNAGQTLTVATHLDLCAHCRQRNAFATRIGGALLDDAADAELTDNSFSRCLERIAAQPAPPPASEPANRPADDIPAMLRESLPCPLDDIPWRRVTPRKLYFPLTELNDDRRATSLFLFLPGTRVPGHGHDSSELTVVLRGAYRDETGLYRRGDFSDLEADDHHAPVIVGDEPCIALVSLEGGVRFDNPLTRFASHFLGP